MLQIVGNGIILIIFIPEKITADIQHIQIKFAYTMQSTSVDEGVYK